MQRANEEIAVIVQVEHIEAVKNIDAILDVPGIDGVFVGPFDMSGSMDLPGQINHPMVQEAIRQVIAACEKRDIARCIYAHTPKHATTYMEQGYRVIGLCTDYIMLARTSAEYGLWFIATSGGFMLGNFITSRTSQRYGVDRMIGIGLVLLLIGSVLTIATVEDVAAGAVG